ncbi:2777_t:CDS:2 [Dentiscutata erythropus]|uniref:2777_t:CDS:1 n=1 Tax=Dentiscutata erythropus TaxID=1348616 RepID=A0A9N9NN35_9GLOM|nr:2777_t:CDS:2 [Dentiscutata erythropus]
MKEYRQQREAKTKDQKESKMQVTAQQVITKKAPTAVSELSKQSTSNNISEVTPKLRPKIKRPQYWKQQIG